MRGGSFGELAALGGVLGGTLGTSLLAYAKQMEERKRHQEDAALGATRVLRAHFKEQQQQRGRGGMDLKTFRFSRPTCQEISHNRVVQGALHQHQIVDQQVQGEHLVQGTKTVAKLASNVGEMVLPTMAKTVLLLAVASVGAYKLVQKTGQMFKQKLSTTKRGSGHSKFTYMVDPDPAYVAHKYRHRKLKKGAAMTLGAVLGAAAASYATSQTMERTTVAVAKRRQLEELFGSAIRAVHGLEKCIASWRVQGAFGQIDSRYRQESDQIDGQVHREKSGQSGRSYPGWSGWCDFGQEEKKRTTIVTDRG